MEDMSAKPNGRLARRNARREAKKRQIAQSALRALIELGFANTSLRDIAEKSELSLGMLHYYFEDRSDLIIHCVATYKQAFVDRLTEALAPAEGRAAVIDAFSAALAGSIHDDAMSHRLWYDIRTQAMFDERFRPIVAEIEETLVGLVRLALEKAGHADTAQAPVAYALLDGAFRFVMQGHAREPAHSRAELADLFRALLARIV